MIYHNGAISRDDAIFEFQDRLRLGDGVFDTMLIIDGAAIHHDLHIDRLLHDASILQIPSLPSAEIFKNAALELIESNESHTGRFALNTLITRGPAKRGLMPASDAQPNIVMRIAPAPETFPPINAIIADTVRRNEGSPLSRIKSCNYGDNILSLLEAQQSGANEAILLNNAGLVTCASAGNIFACIDGALITPPLCDGVMDGITRKIILDKCAAKERSIPAEQLETAQGIYITNSIRGISALNSLNGTPMPEPSIKIDKDIAIK